MPSPITDEGVSATSLIKRRIRAKQLNGLHIGRFILDAEGQPWRIAQICHFPAGVVLEIHHPKRENWATSEPSDEVEYGRDDRVTYGWEVTA